MQSKILFFNKEIFKKNISKIWLLGLVYQILLLLELPVVYLLNYQSYYLYSPAPELYMKDRYVIDQVSAGCSGTMTSIVAIIATLLVFGYLFTQRKSYMMHSFPVSRTALFVTGLMSVLTVMMVPVLTTAVVMIIAAVATGASSTVILAVIYGAFTQLCLSVLFAGLAGFTVMLSGQGVTVAIFYFIFNFLYMGMQFVMYTLLSKVGFGIDNLVSDMKMSPLCPIVYSTAYNYMGVGYELTQDAAGKFVTGLKVNYYGTSYLIIYLIAGILLAAAGLFIYKKKHNETVSDFISVPIVKPIYKMGMAFFSAIFIAVATIELITPSFDLNYDTMVVLLFMFAIVYEAIVFFVMEMLIEKNIKVFNAKNAKQFGMFALASLVVLVAAKSDVLKLDSKLPESPDDVKVAIVGLYDNFVFEDKKDIAAVIEAHKMIIDNKDEIRQFYYRKDNIEGNIVEIMYKYQDGTELVRRYYMEDETSQENSTSYRACAKQLLDVVNQPESIKKNSICPVYDDAIARDFCFSVPKWNESNQYIDYETYEGSNGEYTRSEMAELIYEAILQDIDEGHMGQQHLYDTYQQGYINEMYVNLITNRPYKEKYSIIWGYETSEQYNASTGALRFDENCTNVINTLIDLGILQSTGDLVTNSQVNYWY